MPRLLAALLLIVMSLQLRAQPCPEPTYHKTFRLANGDAGVFNEEALVIPGDILYTIGFTYLSKNGYEFGGIQKYDNTGTLLWHKAYISGHESTDSWTGYKEIVPTADNNLLASGIAAADFYHSYPILQKTDLNGNPLWIRMFPAYDAYTLLSVAALPDGGTAYSCGPAIVGKLDRNGAPVWTKSFQYAGGAPWNIATARVTYGDGAVYVCFNINRGNDPRKSVQLLKLNPDNGAIIWEKKVDDPKFSIYFTQLYIRDKTLYAPYMLDSSYYLVRTNGRIKMDEDGNVQDIVHFVVPKTSPDYMHS